MPIVALRSKKTNTATILEQNILLLVCLLPIFVPFGLVRNLGLQAILVILTGGLAWTAIFLRRRAGGGTLPRLRLWFLGVYVASILASLAVNPSTANLFGTSLLRLGSLELLGCVGIGLALRNVPARTLILSLYGSILLLGIISLPFNLLRYGGQLNRIGGLSFQPDLLAALVGVGILLGIAVWQLAPRWRTALGVAQLYLTVLLFLTQTRAVIGILALLTVLQLLISSISWRRKLTLLCLIGAVLTLGVVAIGSISNNRLGNVTQAGGSVSYRLDLVHFSAGRLTQKPLFGYGSGSVRQALECRYITAPSLVKTCHDGYYFNSSHNIFLDRALATGWLGGLAFTALMGLLVWYGRRRQPFVFCTLLLLLYYLTNVTGVTVELLLWIMALQLVPEKKLDNSKHKPI